MSSWKPGGLIRLFRLFIYSKNFSVLSDMRTFLENLGGTSHRFQEVKQGSSVNSEAKKKVLYLKMKMMVSKGLIKILTKLLCFIHQEDNQEINSSLSVLYILLVVVPVGLPEDCPRGELHTWHWCDLK